MRNKKQKVFVNFFIAASVLILTIFIQRQAMCENFKYYSKDRRDPFMPLITGEARTSLVGLMSVETIEDVKLEGLIFDPSGKSMAVLNGEVVKEGDKICNIEIVKIANDAITIKIDDKSYTLNLSEKGGETLEE